MRNPIADTPLLSIFAGAFSGSGVRKDDSRLECWDDAPGASFDSSAAPLGQPVRNGDVGTNHACAVLTDDTARCWGEPEDGKCDPPIGVASEQVTVGGFHSCGIRADDGHVMCWGRNTGGQATPPDGIN